MRHRGVGLMCVFGLAFGVVLAATAAGSATVARASAKATKVSSFSPLSGPVGTKVAISGSGFTGTKSVKFNGVPAASFKVVSPTSITAKVPAAATSGKISVGSATSTASFSVTPNVASFAPAAAVEGASVVITGNTFAGATAVSFNGVSAVYTVDSPTQITATVPAGATSGKVSVTTPSGVGTSSTNFTVQPNVTGFSPSTGPVGTSVTITGTTLNGATAVAFNGSSASFVVNSPTQITATVPAGATTGTISVTTPSGVAASTLSFTVSPTITGIAPTQGPVGTNVVISGTTFNGATTVTFNGVASYFTVNSSTQITATVPATATTGTIAVTTPGGVATSSGPFTVTPTIASFAPASGPVFTSVVITGTTLAGASAVTFGGNAANFVVNSPTQITATVPPTISGPITVTTPSGTATSATPFTVTPSVVVSPSPSVGPPTSTVTISGYGFSPTQLIDVYFGGTNLGFAGTDQTGSFTGFTTTVPASASPGIHTISLVERDDSKYAQTSFLVRTDWAGFRGGPRHRGYNAFENVLSTSTVSGLDQAWLGATGGTVQSSPSVVGGTVYVGAGDGKLYTFDATTGAPGWTASLGAAITGSPAVVGNTVYVGANNGNLYALRTYDGSTLWQATASPAGTLTSPAVADGVVYVSSGNGNLYAFNANTGGPVWTAAIGSAMSSSPAVANGLVYVGATNGNLYAVRVSNGTTAWTYNTGGAVTSSPAVSNGTVYVGTSNSGGNGGNTVDALNASTGALFWAGGIGSSVASSPAVANGVVYVGANNGNVYALSAQGGWEIWRSGTNASIGASSPTIANGVVYIGSTDQHIYAMDASNGNVLWNAITGGAVRSSPTIVNGVVYVGSDDTNLHVYTLAAGTTNLGKRHSLRTAPREVSALSEMRRARGDRRR